MVARHIKCFWLITVSLVCFVSYLDGEDKQAQVPVFKMEVENVFVRVSVTDPLNRRIVAVQDVVRSFLVAPGSTTLVPNVCCSSCSSRSPGIAASIRYVPMLTVRLGESSVALPYTVRNERCYRL